MAHPANRPSFGIKRLALDCPEDDDDLPTGESHERRHLGVDVVHKSGAGRSAESRSSYPRLMQIGYCPQLREGDTDR